MTTTEELIEKKTGWLHGVLPGKTHHECKAAFGCAGLVFLGGMLLTGVSFFAERAIIRAFRKVL